ncbi:hypothetical protein NIES4071_02470 [Calothrix sp. NIES-4071]|nr:hypothetical protein NIES4071_02470 [Calothrix sp. NIES-4071]BAZ54593.1 hypothetical protein NIES4105_02460 [Calothrix sp. NIES-4105]
MWILVLITVNVCSLFASLIAAKPIKVFLKRHKTIADEYVLEEFKTMVRHQMYMVYFILFFNVIGLFLSIVAVVNHGLIGLIVALVTNACSFYQSQYFRKIEKRARSLDTANELLARRYYQISDTWVNKPLPDF